jgi:Ni/Co efflux regulator RcnB
MNWLLGSVFAVTIFASVPALAAPGDLPNQKFAQRNPDEGRGQDRRGEDGRNEGPGQAGPARGPQDNGRAPQGNSRGPGQPQGGPRTGAPQPAQAAPARGPRGNDRGQNQTARGPGNAARAPVEHGPQQFERRAFQRNVTAPQRFRAGAFRAPPGWQYRRWTYGESLPRVFWAQPYWIANFWLYDLDRPPLGCEWVRSGPDALLVDTSTGEILEAEYNVFY